MNNSWFTLLVTVAFFFLISTILMAAAPTPEMLEQPGGVKCKFFDKNLVLMEDKIFYWDQLIDVEHKKMVFKSDDGIYTIQDGNINPWICIPIGDPV